MHTELSQPYASLEPEDYLRLVESLVQAVWVTDGQGNVRSDSPAWRAYTGQTTAEFLGDGWLNAVHPEHRSQFIDQWRKALSHSSTLECECRLRHAEDTWRWTCIKMIPNTNADGIVSKWIGAVTDISAKKEAELTLQQSEMLNSALFNSIDEGFCIIEVLFDEAGAPCNWLFCEVNPAFEKNNGLVNAAGKTILELTPDIEPKWFEIYGRVALTGEPLRFEEHSEALGRWFSLYAFQIGKPSQARVAVLFTDITQQKRSQEVLKHLEQRNSFLLDFSDRIRKLTDPIAIQYQAAHLLGEYLGANRVGYAQSLEDEELVAVTRHYSRDVQGIEGVYRYIDYGPQLLLDMQKGQTVVRSDIANDPSLTETEKKAHQMLQLGATVNMPLVKEGSLVAVLFVHFDQAHRWTPQEIGLIEEIGERIWAAVELSQAEQSMRESEEKYRTIFNSIEEGFSLLDIQFDSEGNAIDVVIRDANPAQDRIDGVRSLIGKRIREFLPGMEMKWISRYGEVARTGEAAHFEDWSEPNQRWYEVNASRVGGPGSTLVAVVYNDITERKKANESLQEASRRKDEFLAMLAHELRNPMAVLRSGIQLLAVTEGLNDASKKTVVTMSRQMEHLVRLVDDLLELSRITQGKIQLSLARVELGAVVGGVVDAMQAQYSARGKKLLISTSPVPLYVHGDATRLAQVVSNLLTNGLRYTDAKGHVHVTLESSEGQAVLRVADDGIGLSKEQLTSIFDLFVQGENAFSRSEGGLGIGLTLVERLVKKHSGKIEAYSAGLGQGSEFIIQLPLMPEAPTEPSAPRQTPGEPNRGKRILIIDDNVDAASVLAAFLRLKGFEVSIRHDGLSGINAATQAPPAVILCDIGMEDMDGYETARLIRQQAWGKAVELVALTGYGGRENKIRAQQAGFDHHFLKPVDLDELVEFLHREASNS